MDRKLLELLVCPQSKSKLHYDKEKQELLSKRAKLAYPIRDGVPIMLTDEARNISDDELAKLK
ncbi:MAG: Trm112 family protein [Marinicaulis sp.]|nr:Trm112 family protein [Marinicaulis sp.]NNE41632.1 Trm112 family protein [Marinicaulis sp.]NNL90223.1 Trm112 family protein [Marinicaulis sp.]